MTMPFNWNRPIGQLEVGKPKQITIPRLKPVSDAASGAEIERAWGQIVIGKAETIDVEGMPSALRCKGSIRRSTSSTKVHWQLPLGPMNSIRTTGSSKSSPRGTSLTT